MGAGKPEGDRHRHRTRRQAFFTPVGNAIFFLTELDVGRYFAFRLRDLGLGEPELGYVSQHELAGKSSPTGVRRQQAPVPRQRRADGSNSRELEPRRNLSEQECLVEPLT
jgi:hypothetical protein